MDVDDRRQGLDGSLKRITSRPELNPKNLPKRGRSNPNLWKTPTVMAVAGYFQSFSTQGTDINGGV